MTSLTLAAVDLGAESGRVARVQFDGERLRVDIHHRFRHLPRERGGRLRWNTQAMWDEISRGLGSLASSVAAASPAGAIASIGVDSWGVDYGLFSSDGALLDDPTSYRDPKRLDVADGIIEALGPDYLYSATGTQVMGINTLFGLVGDASLQPELLESAARFVMLPDIFHSLLSGTDVTEETAASTTGMYDLANRRWATELVERAGLPTRLLPEVVAAGTDVGRLRRLGGGVGLGGAGLGGAGLGGAGLGGAAMLEHSALRGTRVIVPAAHDTASAVATIPDAGVDTLFISSGTWSLVGVVLDEPQLTPQARRLNLTNEAGYGNRVLFMRNVVGLWALQECRREWEQEGITIGGRPVDYESIVALAEAEEPCRSVIDLNAPEFLASADMPERIRAYCRRHAIHVPETIGQLVRLIIDSLALSYRLTAEDIAASTGVRPRQIAVVGGGGLNSALQQATADATGLPVVCWAVEASAIGNAAAQLVALGQLGEPGPSLAGDHDRFTQLWDLVRASVEHRLIEPRPDAGREDRWSAAAETLRDLERHARRTGPEETGVSAFAHQHSGG